MDSMVDNIPQELKNCHQWVVSNAKKGDKVPHTALAKIQDTLTTPRQNTASIKNPAQWAAFKLASVNTDFDSVGFVLTEDDDFTIIDLDNKPERPATPEQLERFSQIIAKANSYTETSAGGHGVHIIVRGKVPHSVHREGVEIYSKDRYMVCTGNVINPQPIKDGQALLDELVSVLAPPEVPLLESKEATRSDADILTIARDADNRDKFNALWEGDIGGYQSQSDADLALMSILCFYTESNEQVINLFHQSALGKRKKAHRKDYLESTISRARITLTPTKPNIDLTNLLATAQAEIDTAKAAEVNTPTETPENGSTLDGMPLPDGLVGDIAKYIMDSSAMSFSEIAVGAALGYVAGLTGRAYNISGAGLNIYTMIMAETGRGKESGASGISRLQSAVAASSHLTIGQYKASGSFASPQGLVREIGEKKSCVSIMSEFGITMAAWAAPNASQVDKGKQQMLLDLYSKCGRGMAYDGSAYASKDNNIQVITNPALSIICEGTPSSFYDGLSSEQVISGLLPRFLVLEYKGKRKRRNKNANVTPPETLVSHIGNVANAASQANASEMVTDISISPDADQLLDEFADYCDDEINEIGVTNVRSELLTRAYLSAVKIAGLLAVGVGHVCPQVNVEQARWAIQLVSRSIRGISDRFENGGVGTGDDRACEMILALVRDFPKVSLKDRRKRSLQRQLMDQDVLVSLTYINRSLRGLTPFVGHRLGSGAYLNNMVRFLVDYGQLEEIPRVDMRKAFGISTTGYRLVPE